MATELKRVLIVYAHESSHSFNAAAKDEAVKALEAQGCTVAVSDLYALKFKVTTTAEDVVGYIQEEDFDYADVTEKAWSEGKLAADICEEQRKLKEADLVIFQFPMYWFSAPAIVKGWIDRVLTKGFAYKDVQGVSQGLFSDTKVLLSFTTGSQESMYRAQSKTGHIKFTLCPILHGTLNFCGFKVLEPQIFWAPSSATDEERKALLAAWHKRLTDLKNEKLATPQMPEIMPGAKKRVLIVYAHQSQRSFNAAAKDKAREILEARGCTVDVSDLYASAFKDCTKQEDLEKLSAATGEEQCKLKEADLVIFQFPMYWFSVPAILKGWIDRVLTKGFAYTDEKCFSQGLFNKTSALLSFTTGSQESMFSAQGINGEIMDTLCPVLHGTLNYCGFKVLKPQVFWSPSHSTKEEREKMLGDWQDRLKGIDAELLPTLKPEVCQKATESGESSKSPAIMKAGV